MRETWVQSLVWEDPLEEGVWGSPLQCSCLENPRDAGASWAAIYGVAQSRTRLKRLSSSSRQSLLAETLKHDRASLMAQRLKCLPVMRETWVQSLGREDPLEKEMATHSSILAWRIPWTEEPGGLQSGRKEVDITEWLHFHLNMIELLFCFICLTVFIWEASWSIWYEPNYLKA